jgi:hypothetical protein
MNQGTSGSIGRLAAGCLLGALMAHQSIAQSNIVNQISATMFQNYHRNLSVGIGQNRGFTKKANPDVDRVPSAQHNAARDYIRTIFANLGLNTKLQPFSFTTNFGGPAFFYTGCNNVIARIDGSNPQTYGYYIVGAGYDSLDAGQPNPMNLAEIAPRSPGADMNGSGVAALLCLADVLSKQTFRSTILFVAFDASQKNFAGAGYFVSKSTSASSNNANRIYRPQIKGMLSIDTIAYNRKGGIYKNKVLLYGGSETVTKLRRKLGGTLTRYGGLEVLQGGSVLNSDHGPFWNAGINACSVHEAAIWVNPYTFTANDHTSTSNYIDYAYAAKITRGVAGYLCEQAGLQ